MQAEPYIEVVAPGRNRVLVLHANNGESTFIIPSGYTDSYVLETEEKMMKKAAEELFEKARHCLHRAEMAQIAQGLIKD